MLPVWLVAWYSFDRGPGVFWDSVTSPEALHALYLTILITLIAVPLNTVFGITAALVEEREKLTEG